MFENIEKLIRDNIKKDVKVIKRFMGGMSNFTYLIAVEKKLYTYRIPGKNSEVFINREIEKKNIELIDKLNLNCENVYLNTTNGHKMSIYIEGEDLTNIEIDYKEVSNKLKSLHNSGIKAVNNYDKLERLNYYESLLNNTHESLYYDLKSMMFDKIENYKDVNFVFCHGDSQQANWIKSNELYLLDWEYAANNDPFYDIACFGNVDFNNALILLDEYLGRMANVDEVNRLMLNRMFQCLQWYNVALYKEQIGLSVELSIDFIMISNKYIKLAKEFYDLIEKNNN